MIAPDATSLLAFMLERITRLISNIKVRPNNMIRNMNRSNGRQFSEAVLLALIRVGMPRQEAYGIVQWAAMESYGADTFQTKLMEHPDIEKWLPADKLTECFDLGHTLRHTHIIIDRALSMQ
jgi:adenylosuccinate lyase